MSNLHWTVLVMKPDEWRQDECCAADWISREFVTCSTWVSTEDVEQAAVDQLRTRHGAFDCSSDDFEVVAVYPGHLFDHHIS